MLAAAPAWRTFQDRQERIEEDELVAREVDSVIAFGPVPSRRLGRSVGVNNIPPKVCTYASV